LETPGFKAKENGGEIGKYLKGQIRREGEPKTLIPAWVMASEGINTHKREEKWKRKELDVKKLIR